MVAYPISEAWAKTNERERARLLRKSREAGGRLLNVPAPSWHPFCHHCIDVAVVAYTIMTIPVYRRRLEAAAGRPLDDADLQRLAVFVALHDGGKASSPFARKAYGLLGSDHDLVFLTEVRRYLRDASRSDAAIAAGVERMLDWTAGDAIALTDFFSAVVNHHGGPRQTLDVYVPAADAWEPVSLTDTNRGFTRQHHPIQALERLVADIERAFPKAFGPIERPLPCGTAIMHMLAAITMAADWIASTERLFPYDTLPSEDRIAALPDLMSRAMLEIGLGVMPRIAEAYTDISAAAIAVCGGRQPRPLQETVRDLPLTANLLLLEDTTGAGKTEAGLIWALRLIAAGEVSGLCFALPTRSSAAQIYSRVREMCKTLLPGLDPDRDIVCAVPGYDVRHAAGGDGSGAGNGGGCTPAAQDREEEDATRVTAMEDPEMAGGRAVKRTLGWAAESSKKYLAAPIVVGTIDQVLLSILRVRHAHLRSTFLARHLLVVDEVHASDPYMARLTAEVVNRQIALSGRVLLMSATLGASARRLYTGEPAMPIEDAMAAPYPLATACEIQDPAADPNGGGRRRRTLALKGDADAGGNYSARRYGVFSLRCTPHPIGQIDRAVPRVVVAGSDHTMEKVRACVECGGRVLIIKSTTRSARAMLDEVQDAGLPVMMVAGKPTLHHSRFAREDRLLLDAAIEAALKPGRTLPEAGTGGRRPGGMVCIATQTAEQSLDIDADLLVTDPAPADVLIQRLGRLHRHLRTERPVGFEEPLAFIIDPGDFDNYLRPPRPKEESPRFVQAHDWLDFALVYDNLLAVRRTVAFFQAAGPDGRVFHPYEDARPLVERCTDWGDLAGEYARMQSPKADLWARLGLRIFGEDRIQRQIAEMNLIDWKRPFDEQLVGQPDETISARLGIDEVTVEFPRGTVGPFGRMISRVSVRRSWLGNEVVPDPYEVAAVDRMVDRDGTKWLRFQVGTFVFRYDSLGCRKTD